MTWKVSKEGNLGSVVSKGTSRHVDSGQSVHVRPEESCEGVPVKTSILFDLDDFDFEPEIGDLVEYQINKYILGPNEEGKYDDAYEIDEVSSIEECAYGFIVESPHLRENVGKTIEEEQVALSKESDFRVKFEFKHHGGISFKKGQIIRVRVESAIRKVDNQNSDS